MNPMLSNRRWFLICRLASSWLEEYSPLPLEEAYAAQEDLVCLSDPNTDILPSPQCLKNRRFPGIKDQILQEFHKTFLKDVDREHRIFVRNP
jgi:hypothetical protein